jgi:hypothetical protein
VLSAFVPSKITLDSVALAGIVVPFTLVWLANATGSCAVVAVPLKLLNAGCAQLALPVAAIPVEN